MDDGKADVLRRVAEALSTGNECGARALARAEYPFGPRPSSGRRYSDVELARLFFRDGFLDRYTGRRLVFPGALMALSLALPEEFPYHRNWKMDACHPAYWELAPTLDHVVPVARGGPDEASNWVTASMLSNARKAHWTLEELGWELLPAGDLGDWDGLAGWATEYAIGRPEIGGHPYVRRWAEAARRARGASGG